MRSSWHKAIGWSELAARVIGLGGVLFTGMRPSPVILPASYYIVATVGFVLAIQAGWLLLASARLGVPLSALVQALQIVQVSSGAAAFAYAAGLQVLVRVTPSGWKVSPGMNAGVWIGPTSLPFEPFVAVNLLAPIMLWILLRSSPVSQRRGGEGKTPAAAAQRVAAPGVQDRRDCVVCR